MLKIETEPQEKRLLTLAVEVEEERVQRARRAAARRLSRKANIPGFRKGKAPYEVILRQFGDGAVMEEALEELGQQVYKEALEQAELDPIGPGALDDVKLNPLVLTYTVPLRPLVELGDYRAVRVEWTPGAVSQEAFHEQMEHLREHQAAIDPVDRPAQMLDVVVVNVAGHLTVTAEGEEGFLLNDQNVSVLLTDESDWPAPGFAQHFVGMSAGEEKTVEYAFSDEYANEDLRGKAAEFHIHMLEVKSRVLPEWSDSLAQAIGDFESLDDLRAKVRADMQEQADRQVSDSYAREALEEIVKGAKVEYPDVALEEELDSQLDDVDRRLREQGLTLDDFYRIQSTDAKKLRSELEPRARERLVRSVVLRRIVEMENLTVDVDQVEERIGQLRSGFGSGGEAFQKLIASEVAKESVAVNLLKDKAIERIIAIAKGEAPPLEVKLEEAEPVEGGAGEAEADSARAGERAGETETAGAAEPSMPAHEETVSSAEVPHTPIAVGAFEERII